MQTCNCGNSDNKVSIHPPGILYHGSLSEEIFNQKVLVEDFHKKGHHILFSPCIGGGILKKRQEAYKTQEA